MNLMKQYNQPSWFLLIVVIQYEAVIGYGQKDVLKQVTVVKNYEELYSEGKESYLDNDFKTCVIKLEAAIRDYKFYSNVVSKCKLKCNQKKDSYMSVLVNSPDMIPFEKLIHQTLCVMKCKRKSLSNTRTENIETKTTSEFESKKPYDYLQLCYYQTGDLQGAANAAFTHLVHNQDHEAMRENVKFYMELPEVDKDSVKNLDEPAYVALYLLGTDYYRSEEWTNLVDTMEEALKEYLVAEELCRVDCDKPFDMGWYPDFTSSVANHFTFCLKCKMNCAQNLNNFNGEFMDDLLPSFYHYLQFGYYKVGKVREAAQCSGTFLFLKPGLEDMEENARYYREVEGVEEKWFNPRPEAVDYVNRDNDEEALLNFIESSYVFDEVAEDPEEVSFKKSETSSSENELDNDEFIAKKRNLASKRKSNLSKMMNIGSEITKDVESFTEKSNRLLVSDILSQKECNGLISTAKLTAHSGDGYVDTPMDRGIENPHTNAEIMKGITIGKLALFVIYGLVDWSHLESLLNHAESMRMETQVRLSPERTIYSTYTHLVCRRAKPGPKVGGRVMSHALHADNCQLKTNTCDHEPPAYFYRDFSALLYLNNEFSGGSLVFAERDEKSSNMIITDTILPQCGKMAIFTSGSENIHGVKPIFEGERCILAMWYSLNSDYEEPEIDLAKQVLSLIKSGQNPTREIRRQLEDLTMFSEKKS